VKGAVGQWREGEEMAFVLGAPCALSQQRIPREDAGVRAVTRMLERVVAARCCGGSL